MPRWIALLALPVLACGGSEEAGSTPEQTPAQSAPARAPRPPSFPAADQIRLGEPVVLRQADGSGTVECNKLYVADRLVAVVRTYAHFGRGAIAVRCFGQSWADPGSPTAQELEAVGPSLDGQLGPGYEGIGIAADGSLTFASLDLPDRVSEVAIGARWVAYAATSNVRDAAGGGGQEADIVGIVFDVPSRSPLQQFLLGTCRLGGSGGGITLDEPTWSGDGRAVTFHGLASRCTFEEVETHPE